MGFPDELVQSVDPSSPWATKMLSPSVAACSNNVSSASAAVNPSCDSQSPHEEEITLGGEAALIMVL